MLNESFNKFYSDALDATIKEVEQYQNENDLWKIIPGTLNCGGNLVLHIAGNLKYFFGTVLGDTGYIRNRDNEFSLKDIPKEELIKQITEAKQVVQSVITNLSEADLQKDYPPNERQQGGSTGNQVIRLLGHLNYHLGQLNYHRRIITA